MINLEYFAARIANGTVNADEIKSIVDSLLVDGIYADEFIDIMESKPARIDDVFPPFIAFLQKEGIPIPTKDQALWQIIGHHLHRIASGAADPIAELRALTCEIDEEEIVGDTYGVEHLFGLYWYCHYDYLTDRQRVLTSEESHNLEIEILHYSENWMKSFAHQAILNTLHGDASDRDAVAD